MLTIRRWAPLLALTLAGCGTQPRISVAVAPASAIEAVCAQLLSALDLGFSLASATAEVPRHPAGIEAFIADRHSAAAVVVVATPPSTGAGAFDWASVAGLAVCRAPAERVRIEGDPPRLTIIRPLPLALERSTRGAARLASREAPEARSEWAAAAAIEPAWTEPLALAGDAYLDEERWDEAASIYRRLVARSPWIAPAHARLGRALLRDGRADAALAELRTALALAPADEIVPPLIEEAGGEVVPPVAPPAEREPSAGGALWRLRAGSAAETAERVAEATAYASCKEAFRNSETLRRDAAGLAGPDWRWSVAEEDLCTVLWLDAYARNRNAGRRPDATMEGLLDVVARGLLSERSLFDVGARAHPHAPSLLRVPARNRLVEFVTRHRAIPRTAGRGWLAP